MGVVERGASSRIGIMNNYGGFTLHQMALPTIAHQEVGLKITESC
jgi:hypothetical protein